MEWSPQQDRALRAVANWLHARDPAQQVFRLFGYAGTGKTTLARHFAEGVDGRVQFAAFTGKAAHVLAQKGCVGACTLHSLLYHPNTKPDHRLRLLRKRLKDEGPSPELERAIEEEEKSLAQPSFRLNEQSDLSNCSLLVVDECSMVGERLGQDLLAFDVPVLVLGDPAQLPPVASGGFFTNQKPDFMLTEIHRQARDNPIIELATLVRQGERLSVGRYGDSEVRPRCTPTPEAELLGTDQLLVGRNKTRIALNRHCRKLLGRTSWIPEEGDKLVCLRNDNEAGLLNGSLWRAVAAHHGETYLDLHLTDGERELAVQAHHGPLRGEELRLPWFKRREAQEFDYGYALTVHKAQGSQWDSVLVYDESRSFRQDAQRWLYTAITRAAERVTVVPR